ncbi:MAG: transketolase family protein [Bacillota bacterium]|nr:transketolase family protein [Bacillota bacterium]
MQFDNSEMLLREVNCRVLSDLAYQNQKIVVLDADLMNASGFSGFKKEHPERFFNCGIQEANMIGVAGGLSYMGLIPVVHTFAAFASRRAADQVFVSGVYSKQNIKILGTDPGVCNSPNGGTHMALEDIGIMRTMPGMYIVDPTDEVMLRNLIPQIIETDGMFYVRLFRKTKIKVYDNKTTFKLGKANTAHEGKDITIIASGAVMVPEALKACEELENEGYSVRILDMFTIKPLDKEAVLKAAAETGAILTAENHNIIGGLGSAVAEVLSENRIAVPFFRIGVRDSVGETGSMDFILKKYHMDYKAIYEEAKKLIESK